MAKKKLLDSLKDHLSNVKKERQVEKRKILADEKVKKLKKEKNDRLCNVFKWTDGYTCTVPYRRDAQVLVVGDGDFSFSLALAGLLENSASIHATVYDDEDAFKGKYPGNTNDKKLSNFPNVSSVQFNVDAVKLSALKGLNPDVIVFNFPHTGSGIHDKQRNVYGNQKMLEGFFGCCRKIFEKRSESEISMTVSRVNAKSRVCLEENKVELDSQKDFAEARSVQPYVYVALWCGEPYDSWNIKGIAKAAGFNRVQACPFAFEDYPGYVHSRTDGCDAFGEMSKKPSRLFMFTF